MSPGRVRDWTTILLAVDVPLVTKYVAWEFRAGGLVHRLPQRAVRVKERVEPARGRGRLGHKDVPAVDFTSRVTLDAISDLIGVPPEDREQLLRWAQSIVVGDDPELVALYGTAEDGRRNSCEYMQRLLVARRAEPREDFATYVASADSSKGELSDADRVGILRLVMEASADTTIATMPDPPIGVPQFVEYRLGRLPSNAVLRPAARSRRGSSRRPGAPARFRNIGCRSQPQCHRLSVPTAAH